MSKTSLLWVITALLIIIIAMVFEACDLQKNITTLTNDNTNLQMKVDDLRSDLTFANSVIRKLHCRK